MVRLTVLYNLAPDVDEEEFLQWRLTDHQEENLSMEGVLRTDFARIDDTWPNDTETPYSYMTTADWPDWESFKKGFYAPEVQDDLKENLRIMGEWTFLVSEVLVNQEKEDA